MVLELKEFKLFSTKTSSKTPPLISLIASALFAFMHYLQTDFELFRRGFQCVYCLFHLFWPLAKFHAIVCTQRYSDQQLFYFAFDFITLEIVIFE